MSCIDVGRIVGWGSDMPYAEHVYSEGRVVAMSGDYLTILNEKIVANTPHYNPFLIRRVDHVWLIEGKNNDDHPG